MEYYNSEQEPLLTKDNYTIDINDISSQGKLVNQISKKQILNKSCSCNNIFENLFFCCIDYDLTNIQYELYIDLRNKLSIPYNQEDPIHAKMLQDFFNNLNDIIPEEEDKELENINESNTISTNINNESNPDNNLIKRLSQKVGFQNNS